jgi:translation initiation factor 1 (eIF-1/SUI1)
MKRKFNVGGVVKDGQIQLQGRLCNEVVDFITIIGSTNSLRSSPKK